MEGRRDSAEWHQQTGNVTDLPGSGRPRSMPTHRDVARANKLCVGLICVCDAGFLLFTPRLTQASRVPFVSLCMCKQARQLPTGARERGRQTGR